MMKSLATVLVSTTALTEACSELPTNPASCDWYNCFDSVVPCGSNGYALGYGGKYCNKFANNIGKFSSRGQQWVNATKLCLQNSLVPLRDQALASAQNAPACDEVYHFAFKSHPGCYTHPDANDEQLSICHLPGDWPALLSIVYTAFIPPSLDKDGIEQVLTTLKQCVQQYGSDVKEVFNLRSAAPQALEGPSSLKTVSVTFEGLSDLALEHAVSDWGTSEYDLLNSAVTERLRLEVSEDFPQELIFSSVVGRASDRVELEVLIFSDARRGIDADAAAEAVVEAINGGKALFSSVFSTVQARAAVAETLADESVQTIPIADKTSEAISTNILIAENPNNALVATSSLESVQPSMLPRTQDTSAANTIAGWWQPLMALAVPLHYLWN